MPDYYFYAGEGTRESCNFIRTVTPFTLELLTRVLAFVYDDLSQEQLLADNGLKIEPPITQESPEYHVRILCPFNPQQFARPDALAVPSERTTPAPSRHATPPESPAGRRSPLLLSEPTDPTAAVPPSARVRQESAATIFETAQQAINRCERKELQPLLRAACLARDRCCVVSRVPFPANIEAAHVLHPSYARNWFQSQPRRLLALTPQCNRRNGDVSWSAGYDVKNAIMLEAGLHRSFDSFEWAITRIDGVLRTFVFKGLCPSWEVLVPSQVPGQASQPSQWANYYLEQFPSDEVFAERFRQSVLRNMKANGFRENEPYRDEGEEGVIVAGLEDDECDCEDLSVWLKARDAHRLDIVGNSLFL